MRDIFMNIEKIRPVVQCITNFVTVNDCANIVLACGGSPTMAYDFREAEDIAEKADALVLNMGTVSDTDAMIVAGKKSNELNHPVILDPVGVGGSRFRIDTFRRLSESMQFSVIRGNVSEIKAIAFGESDIRGVDATAADQICEGNINEIVAMAKKLSGRMKSVIVISGPIDVVANEETAYLVRNGHPIMAKVTGSGCMSTAMLGAFCGGNSGQILEAALASTVTMGVCGELAYQKTLAQSGGTMTFRMHLIYCFNFLKWVSIGRTDYNGAGMVAIKRAIGGEARPEAFWLKTILTAIALEEGYKGGEIVNLLYGATLGRVLVPFLGISPSFAPGLELMAVFCGVTNGPIASGILCISYSVTMGCIVNKKLCVPK